MHAKSDMSQLVRMMPLAVLVPTNALLGLVMPASRATEKQHQPFTHSVTIEKMEDRIDVMTSLQRPKKVDLSTFAQPQRPLQAHAECSTCAVAFSDARHQNRSCWDGRAEYTLIALYDEFTCQAD